MLVRALEPDSKGVERGSDRKLCLSEKEKGKVLKD